MKLYLPLKQRYMASFNDDNAGKAQGDKSSPVLLVQK